MVRMIFRGRINGKANNVRRLTELDIPSLIKLYAERRGGLDGGVFFDPIMVHRGCSTTARTKKVWPVGQCRESDR
jgi:hypothetical protein